MTVRAVVVAIHGILTRTTSPSWPDHLNAFLRDCKVERRDYWAWPFPRLNVFVRNRLASRSLAEELELLVTGEDALPLHFVAHSNGCDIALKTVRRLADRGIRTETVILTGSVTEPDVEKSGVAELVDSGMLGTAFAYCSADDVPLKVPLKWPYKSLGCEGWKLNGRSYEDPRIRTRWFAGGHGAYFCVGRRKTVFAQMRSDLGL